jgi:hypothetical protein
LGSKLLFWMAVAMGVAGMHSPEGNLYFFFAVHSSMLMIGCMLHRREKRKLKTVKVKASSSKSVVPASKVKSG